MTITPITSWGDLRVWLLLVILVLSAQTWVLWGKAWRREPPGFIWRTFMDDRGVPDAKIVAACHAVVIMSITMMVGWVTSNWPPYYVWITWDFLAVACILGSTYVTKRYYDAGGSTEPHPDLGMGQPNCAPAATSNSDTEGLGTAGSANSDSSASSASVL
jgi:hypothetical protein